MKTFWAFLLLGSSMALAVTPDCTRKFTITNDPTIALNSVDIVSVGATPAVTNNGSPICQAWTVIYSTSGFTQISLQVETSSTKNGAYIAWPGTVDYGQIPWTPTMSQLNGYINLTGTYNFLRISTPFVMGVGTAYVQLFGWVNPDNVGSIVNYPGGAGSFTLTTIGSSGAATYLDGTLNIPIYTGGGSSAFSAITSGTNSTATMNCATGCSILASSSGSITATTMLGSGLTGANSVPASTLPLATTGAFGAVKPDGSTITISSGVITAVGGGGSLPSQTGHAAQYLTTNGTAANWGNIVTGASGALDCVTIQGTCDVVTSVVPLKANANTFSGAQTFSGPFSTQGVTSATDGTVASASTIAPTTSLVIVTGTAAIGTITAPAGCTTSGTDCMLTLLADVASGPFTLTAAGNIYAAYSGTIGQAIRLVYFPSASKWYQIH